MIVRNRELIIISVARDFHQLIYLLGYAYAFYLIVINTIFSQFFNIKHFENKETKKQILWSNFTHLIRTFSITLIKQSHMLVPTKFLTKKTN